MKIVTAARLFGLPLFLLAAGCGGTASGADDDTAASEGDSAPDDDDDLTMPPDDSLHGTYPAAKLALPEFEALNSDGTVRGPDHLRGHPTVLWFFPFAGTPV